MYISVENNQYIYRKYDKTNDCPFTADKFGYLITNIPVKPAYGVFISQLVRFTRINQNINGFIKDTIEIIQKLSKQNYNINKLIEKFIHFGRFYPHLWTRFGSDILNKKFKN